jgi:hypothetical protein
MWFAEEVRRFEVEMKSGARREVEQGPSTLN